MNTKKDNTPEEKSEVARREEEMLAFWNEHDIFNKSLLKESPNGDFVFYDGPPFATGLPHYGHILAGTIKDAIPRFWAMNGYRVRRKWGWDCHGLPLENIIEKRLGLATKRDIEELGVKKFNETARSAVLEYADDWKRIVPRMGRWVDMEDDYKTMDASYTESVWWVFKSLHEKGLVYEGFKSMHLSPRSGTTLSNFEVNLGYKDIKDIAVTVKLPLLNEKGEVTDTSLLVWTTTPWTIPGNMAAAVHEEYDYAKVKVTTESGDEQVILAKDRLSQLGTDEYEILEEMKGTDLVGKAYIPPFDYWQKQEFEGKENAWKIYHADYVELGEEGTGAVHLAPAYGEEDMDLAKEHGVPIMHHVDYEGRFMDFVTDFAGQLVKPKDDDEVGVTHLDADIEIVKALKNNERLFKKENITHSYPHDWRNDAPLINYATTSWFVKVTDIRDELVKENNGVHWVPEHVGRSRFGKWLEGARDWAVSRQRYWGAPLPIWRNPETKEYKVFGSLEDLKEYVPRSGNTYFIMRHGEAQSNVKGILNATIDESNTLTENGEKSAHEGAEILKEKNITKIITSPFPRALQTARIVAKEIGVDESEIEIEEMLHETNVGEFNGKSLDEYHAIFETTKDWFDKRPEGGETWMEMRSRMAKVLFEIERKYQNQTILLVGHSGPFEMIQVAATGIPREQLLHMYPTDALKLKTGEVREIEFIPYPHNDRYELDYHRPYIDEIELYDGETRLDRVPDVFDCWFESGSMPYGQHHYPFEHTDEFEKKYFPANFIAEGLDQTRGWFYSLIVLGTALFKKSPYQNVIVNGLVLAEDGKKMSKSLQNYPDPMELADRVGVDAMRFYLLSSPIMRGEDLNFSEKEVLELQRKNIGRLHNVLAMYESYVEGEGAHTESTHVLDRWIIARTNELVAESTRGFKNYELDKATRPITDFIDDLSVWYLRRSRDRLKGKDSEDKKAAVSTLRHVLKALSLVMAPSMPFYAEYLWSRVKEESDPISVHLALWPKDEARDEQLLFDMAEARRIVSLALEARASKKIKVRQPLQVLTLKPGDTSIGYLYDIIKDEVNVKEIDEDMNLNEGVVLDTNITPELKREGDMREFMRQVQDMRKKSGLEPKDRIVLTVQTSKEGEELLHNFMDEIMRVIGAESVDFDRTEGEELIVGDHSFTISLRNV